MHGTPCRMPWGLSRGDFERWPANSGGMDENESSGSQEDAVDPEDRQPPGFDDVEQDLNRDERREERCDEGQPENEWRHGMEGEGNVRHVPDGQNHGAQVDRQGHEKREAR